MNKRSRHIKVIYEYLRRILVLLPFTLIIILLLGKLHYGDYCFFGYKLLYVPTASMEPTIHSGSFVIGRSTKDVDLKTGDIAVYKKGHDLIVHRIMSFEGDYVVFKGDNNIIGKATVYINSNSASLYNSF